MLLELEIGKLVHFATTALISGVGISLAIRKIRAMLDSKFELPLTVETQLINLYDRLTAQSDRVRFLES